MPKDLRSSSIPSLMIKAMSGCAYVMDYYINFGLFPERQWLSIKILQLVTPQKGISMIVTAFDEGSAA